MGGYTKHPPAWSSLHVKLERGKPSGNVFRTTLPITPHCLVSFRLPNETVCSGGKNLSPFSHCSAECSAHSRLSQCSTHFWLLSPCPSWKYTSTARTSLGGTTFMRFQEIRLLAVANYVTQVTVRQDWPCLRAPSQEDTWELKFILS